MQHDNALVCVNCGKEKVEHFDSERNGRDYWCYSTKDTNMPIGASLQHFTPHLHEKRVRCFLGDCQLPRLNNSLLCAKHKTESYNLSHGTTPSPSAHNTAPASGETRAATSDGQQPSSCGFIVCADCEHRAERDDSEQGNYYTHRGGIDCKVLDTHCKKCGYEYGDGFKYCPICGIKRKKCSCKACAKVKEVSFYDRQ